MDRNEQPLEPGLRQALRDLPVPPPSPDFAARVFAAVRKAEHPAWPHRRVPSYALAASVTLAIGVGSWVSLSDQTLAPGAVTPTRRVEISANEVKPVRLVFRSPRALEGVTVALQLPDGVALAGRSGRQFSWQTNLKAGANVLELPVVVEHGDGGVVTASLSLGQDRKQLSVMVQARRPAVLYLERPTVTQVTAGRSNFYFFMQEETHHA